MQPISAFNDSLGTAILLLGPPGSGKTVLGCRLFPSTYINITDLNFESAKRYLGKIGELSNIVGFSTPGIDEKGVPVQANLRWDRMLASLSEATKDPSVATIFVDSVSFVEDVIKAKICNAMRDDMIKLEGFPQWGSYLVAWKSLILQLRQSGKRVIFSCHEEKEIDKADGIYKYGPAVDGKIKAKFGGLFSDVWRTEVVENLGKHSWQVRLLGNTSHELKNNFGFPATLSQDELVKKVRATLTQPK